MHTYNNLVKENSGSASPAEIDKLHFAAHSRPEPVLCKLNSDLTLAIMSRVSVVIWPDRSISLRHRFADMKNS